MLYEKPDFQGRTLALEEGGIELNNVWAENDADAEPRDSSSMLIGSIRLAVWVNKNLPLLLENRTADALQTEQMNEKNPTCCSAVGRRETCRPLLLTAVFIWLFFRQDYSIPSIDLFTEPEGRGRITSYHDDAIETGAFGIPLSTASIQVYSGV